MNLRLVDGEDIFEIYDIFQRPKAKATVGNLELSNRIGNTMSLVYFCWSLPQNRDYMVAVQSFSLLKSHDIKMARGLAFQWLLSTFFCVLLSFSESIYVMQQDGGCYNIEGTWEHKNEKVSNVSVYFQFKKLGQQLRLQTSASLDDINISFEHERVETNDPYLITFQAHQRSFMDSIDKVQTSTPKDCEMFMKDGSSFTKVQTIKRIHLIYMNHLDVGYNTNQNYPGTDIRMPGYILNVLNWYFQVYFPRAVRLGNELRDIRANETFIYTTHPWLINLYLDCPTLTLSGVLLQCPSEAELVAFRRAIWMGDIAWHAGPLNQEAESSNPELFSYSLTLSQKLDDYFGFKKTARTLSQRDIPGMTQAAIPYLVESNIVAASFGINGASAPPDVPSPNVWKFGNYSIITYWHKGGYPDAPGTSTTKPGGLSRKDCQLVDGLDHALCFAFRTDNYGPPENVLEIKTDFKILRSEFPGAEIKASTFEEFTAQLLPIRNKLPVLDAEVGDTWIQGPASDPVKIARFRTINRMRSQCIKEKQCDVADKRFDDMSRLLIKLPEHTYGISSAFDETHWSNEDFQPLQYLEEGYRNDSTTWLSHRAFNDLSIAALKDHPLAAKIQAELLKLKPYLPDLSNYVLYNSNTPIVCADNINLTIGPDGSLVQLTDPQGRNWANESNPLAKILYRTYNNTDFAINHNLYTWRDEVGFDKPNMDYTKAESRFWDVEAHGIYVAKTHDPCSAGIYVHVIHSDMLTWFKYGAPVSYFLKYTTQNGGIDIDYQFFNKPSTRLPEALFLNFQPAPRGTHRWLIHKLGYLIDPTTVVNNGSQYVHAVDQGVAYLDDELHGLVVESFDVATVTVQTADHDPSPFPTPLAPLKTPPTGMAFNFYNNIWETNFIFWYPYQPQDKHYKARFRLTFQ